MDHSNFFHFFDNVPNSNRFMNIFNNDRYDKPAIEFIRSENQIKIDKNLASIQAKEKNQFVPYYLNDNDFQYKSYFGDQSFEINESSDVAVHSGHRMFDLHGYTTLGAEQALRRIFTSVDRSRQQVIKINVGQGSHSQDGIAKLPNTVRKVAKDLQLPDPVKHEKNPGYLLMILPPIISSE